MCVCVCVCAYVRTHELTCFQLMCATTRGWGRGVVQHGGACLESKTAACVYDSGVGIFLNQSLKPLLHSTLMGGSLDMIS